MLTKLAVKRLTYLANFLDKLPPKLRKKFNMKDVCGIYAKDGSHVFSLAQYGKRASQSEIIEHCGSSACAVGWSGVIPKFNRDGLYVTREGNLRFKRSCGMDASERFFDIPRWVGMELFWGSEVINTIDTPKQWAKMCRKFIYENTLHRRAAARKEG